MKTTYSKFQAKISDLKRLMKNRTKTGFNFDFLPAICEVGFEKTFARNMRRYLNDNGIKLHHRIVGLERAFIEIVARHSLTSIKKNEYAAAIVVLRTINIRPGEFFVRYYEVGGADGCYRKFLEKAGSDGANSSSR